MNTTFLENLVETSGNLVAHVVEARTVWGDARWGFLPPCRLLLLLPDVVERDGGGLLDGSCRRLSAGS
jgi:hypothetical protein